MRKHISQREAQRLRKRVQLLEGELQKQRNVFAQEFVGVEIARCEWRNEDDIVPQSIRVSRKLRHAVVAIGDDSGVVRFVALPLPEETQR